MKCTRRSTVKAELLLARILHLNESLPYLCLRTALPVHLRLDRIFDQAHAGGFRNRKRKYDGFRLAV